MGQWLVSVMSIVKSWFSVYKPAPAGPAHAGTRTILDYDARSVSNAIEDNAKALQEHVKSTCYRLTYNLLSHFRNAQILDINRLALKDDRTANLAYNQGRIAAFTEMISAMDRIAISASKPKEEEVQGEHKVVDITKWKKTRPSNLAGPAL